MKKRYLVTYVDRHIRTNEAVGLLGIDNNTLKEGISYMSTNVIPNENDAIHFKKMGISSIGLTDEEVSELSTKSGVLAVEEDTEMSILGFEVKTESEAPISKATNLWNIDMVKAPNAWANGITGSGVNLAVLDTGIANHPNLVISGGVSYVQGVSGYTDGNGHGTHCAGIAAARNGLNNVYGVAKDSNLYAVKVLDDSGTGYTSWVIAGMEWCVENEINVVSMSLGGSRNPSVAYANAIKNCMDNGITVACASGNAFSSPFPWVGSPANSYLPGVNNTSPIAVGAIEKNSNIATFSSRGKGNNDWNPVTVVAPGVSIYSTYLNDGYATLRGTSMACPHVAGLAALIYQKNNTITPNDVILKTYSTASNLGNSPHPNDAYGYGLIDCEKAIK